MSESLGLKGMWSRFSWLQRWSLIGVAVLCIGGMAASAYWGLRTDYSPLFTQLSEADAATVVAQLKHLKTPYRLSEGGTTVRVPTAQLYETRIALVSSGAPLGGGVGFELFDNQSLGTTEQSQRVSYQRALQGELVRTIGALEHVHQARVHLVMPETSLFKHDRADARAAVVLTLERGFSLHPDQVTGIQRLVAASVQGLEVSRVVVSNQQGVILSLSDTGAGRSGGSEVQLTLKREVEDYFVAKIARLLDATYGSGHALVSVDATLNFDDITRTQQDILPTHGEDGHAVLRRTQSSASVPDERGAGSAFESDAAAGHVSQSSSADYEYSRRVEQVVASPGSVMRLSVGVIVPNRVASEQQQHIRDLVRMAAGLDESRGDAIVVQSLEQMGGLPEQAAGNGSLVADPSAPAGEALGSRGERASGSGQSRAVLLGVGSGALLLVGGLGLYLGRTQRVQRTPRLSDEERRRLLEELRTALDTGSIDKVAI
ncbi:MAG TPA: flagellar basal-body MS-ring/collar protein FliF [Steroidobacteraceae bacterium]